MIKQLGSFSITSAESRDFARTSGDFNPLHLDPVAARRTRFGHTLIHGVCGTLRAVDLLLQQTDKKVSLRRIKVKYNKAVSQGQEMTVVADTKDAITRLELFVDGVRCQIIDLEFADTALENSDLHTQGLTTCPGDAGQCLDLAIEACEGLSGAVDLLWDDDTMRALFPSATRCLPRQQLASLMASTQIVGMKCPGLHSVFAVLELHFCDAAATSGDQSTQLEYSVLKIDARIDRVVLRVGNACVKGTVEAFFRAPPVQQASFEQIASLVSESEFCQQNALIIGGSRGLGEVITKVLAAGGANVLITYSVGRDDAARVSTEIAMGRRAPGICAYNVLEDSLCAEMGEFCASVTHIYYLASPLIARGDSSKWDQSLFNRYCAFYIDGLATLLQRIQAPENRKLHLFIPSSVFLDEGPKGFEEYIAAKAAAEAYVKCFENAHRNWRVLAPRLPRLHTDQTSSLKNNNEQKTVDIIIQQLRLAFRDDPTPSANLA